MKIPVPHNLTQEQARIALDLLEQLIDALMAFYQALRHTYRIEEPFDDLPF